MYDGVDSAMGKFCILAGHRPIMGKIRQPKPIRTRVTRVEDSNLTWHFFFFVDDLKGTIA